jgi:hypothetical protein
MLAALGAVESLSNRKAAHKQLLQIEIIPWILDLLKAYEYLQTYTLEFLTMILLNLTVRTEVKKICQKDYAKFFDILLPLLKLNEKLITTRILGTLYSLLALPEFKVEAKVG